MSELPMNKMPRLIIKGTLSSMGEGEFRGDLVYNFRVSPLAQDLKGNDRVFTFAAYARKEKREAPKHSPDRKSLARILRGYHTLLWDRFHDAMGTR